MSTLFPHSPNDISRWSEQESVSISEASRKYVQYLILQGISDNNSLRSSLVFKGGNALEFFHLPNRSTVDLDFSFIEPSTDIPALVASIRQQLDAAINSRTDGFGTILRVQNLRQNPRGAHITRPTLRASVAYAFADQPTQVARLLNGEPGANIVPVEMTVNEIVCDWTSVSIEGSQKLLLVATREDIVAEKLRAILQQVSRNRYRSQDILDIASIVRQERADKISTSLVSSFLIRKCEAREIVATRSAFRDPEIASRSQTQYADLAETTRRFFIPFDEAWNIVMNLVNQLEIPD